MNFIKNKFIYKSYYYKFRIYGGSLMVGKNNKYLKTTKEGTKVESYSIKKFKVGTASVVIGASIFLGAGAVA